MLTGLLHIGMNMLSVYAIGIQLERLFGTIKLIAIIIYILTFSGLLYILICYSLHFLLNNTGVWLHYRSIGFSGSVLNVHL